MVNWVSTSLLSGKSGLSFPSARLNLPQAASIRPPSAVEGAREVTEMAPPIAFLPNTAPRGPRRTLIRSVSTRSSTLPTERAKHSPAPVAYLSCAGHA